MTAAERLGILMLMLIIERSDYSHVRVSLDTAKSLDSSIVYYVLNYVNYD